MLFDSDCHNLKFIMIADGGKNIYFDKANLSNREDLSSM